MRNLVVSTFLMIYLTGCGFVQSATTAPNVADASSQSASHPHAGFWKDGHCTDDFGLSIAPAGGKLYSVSFCGPGGCFEPGTYRPNTPIDGDPDYRVVDKDTIDVGVNGGGFQRYIRCPTAGGA